MSFLRSITLIWPGLPWAWLRGSYAGLILATAFAICLNLCIITAWIWTSFIDIEITFGIWTATAIIWIVSTVSAISTFPQPLSNSQNEVSDRLFIDARDAYLAGDWLKAETKLQTILTLSPTDGEAQLLFGTLLRRVGRFDEAKKSLEKLERSDSGQLWQHAIHDRQKNLQEVNAPTSIRNIEVSDVCAKLRTRELESAGQRHCVKERRPQDVVRPARLIVP